MESEHASRQTPNRITMDSSTLEYPISLTNVMENDEPYPETELDRFREKIRLSGKNRKIRRLIHMGPALETEVDLIDELRDHFGDRVINNERVYRKPLSVVLRSFFYNTVLQFFYLVALGLTAGIISFIQDSLVIQLTSLRWTLLDLASDHWLRFLIWATCISCLCLCSCLVTRLISPHSAGSGIPEMKGVLSGLIGVLDSYLTFRCLAAKVIGLILILGAGIIVGKEGPFVHTSCVIAFQLVRLQIFKPLRSNQYLVLQWIAAGAAVGVSATFGTPIGGVLFSIEVTSTYYPIEIYWKSFVSAVMASLVFYFGVYFSNTTNEVFASIFDTSSLNNTYSGIEIFYFILLGIAMGFAGALYNHLNAIVLRLRSKVTPFMELITCQCVLPRWWDVPFTFPLILSLMTAIATFPDIWGVYAAEPNNAIIKDAITDLDDHDWDKFSIWFGLIYRVSIVFIFSAVSITLPAPTGMFAPVLTIGSLFGRLAGELLSKFSPLGGIFPDSISASGYAIVGTAAFAAASTHTLSAGVIVLEATGDMRYAIPVLIAVISAVATTKPISKSIYDSTIKVRKLPYMPHLIQKDPINRTVGEYVERDVAFLTWESDYLDVERVLHSYPHQITYPIVESDENRVLMCAIVKEMLTTIYQRYCLEHGLLTLTQFAEKHGLRSYDDVLDLVDARGLLNEAREITRNDIGNGNGNNVEEERMNEDGIAAWLTMSAQVSEESDVDTSKSGSSISTSSSLVVSVKDSDVGDQGDVHGREHNHDSDTNFPSLPSGIFSLYSLEDYEVVSPLPNGMPEVGVESVEEDAKKIVRFQTEGSEDSSHNDDDNDGKEPTRFVQNVLPISSNIESFYDQLTHREEILRSARLDFSTTEGYILDAYPTVLADTMPMVMAQNLFHWQRLQEAYITSMGILVGRIDENCILTALEDELGHAVPGIMKEMQKRRLKRARSRAKQSYRGWKQIATQYVVSGTKKNSKNSSGNDEGGARPESKVSSRGDLSSPSALLSQSSFASMRTGSFGSSSTDATTPSNGGENASDVMNFDGASSEGSVELQDVRSSSLDNIVPVSPQRRKVKRVKPSKSVSRKTFSSGMVIPSLGSVGIPNSSASLSSIPNPGSGSGRIPNRINTLLTQSRITTPIQSSFSSSTSINSPT